MVTVEDAKEVSRALVNRIDPVAVIAFGTVATQGRGHDLDILVVTKDQQDDDYSRVGSALRDFYRRFAIDYFVASIEGLTNTFRKGSPFLRMVQREGRLMHMTEDFRNWEELAKEDFEQAQYLRAGTFYRGACFSAQQAVEKTLKGVLLKKGWELQKIHSVRRLVSIAEGFDLSLEIAPDDIDFIDSIYRGRYPAEEGLLPLTPPGKNEAERAIRIAGEVLTRLGIH